MTRRIPRLLAGGFVVIGVGAVILLILNIVQSAFGQAQPSADRPCTITPNSNPSAEASVAAGTSVATDTIALPEIKSISGTIGIGSKFTLEIENLSKYLEAKEKSAQTIVPFINGRALKGLYPECIDLDRNKLQFHLSRTSDNKDVLDPILRASLYDDNIMDFKHEVLVSAGHEEEKSFAVRYKDRQYLIVAEALWFWLWLIASIVVAIALFGLAIEFNLLRVSPSNDKLLDFLDEYKALGIKPAYSLGLFQVAWWFILIFSSFIFLNFITWNINIITAGTAGLLGISVATAVGAVAINSSGQTSEQIDKVLESYKQRIDGKFGKFPEKVDPVTSKNVKTTIQNATCDEIAQVRRMACKAVLVKRKLMLSENIIKDALYDANGGGLHRVQIIIWTIVLGCMFIWTVGTTIRMPEFDPVLLALIGLSAGTYIGLKIPGTTS